MPLTWNRRRRIAPGTSLNVSKSGASVSRRVPVASVSGTVEWITGSELTALYGTCECGSPLAPAEVEMADGTEMNMLVCVCNPMVHAV